MENKMIEKYIESVRRALDGRMLRKAVFSRSLDPTVIKSEMKPFDKSGERLYQIESFTKDGKALHRNMSSEEALEYFISAIELYKQINLLTSGGDLEVLVSKKGALHINGRITSGEEVKGVAHDRQKNYILNKDEHRDFLVPLGVCTEKGEIIEKKRSKYRQIERFLELIDDLYSSLPSKGRLCICDLCCGKSYLTFAVYYYLVSIKKRDVIMYGVDLKKDVIEFCSSLADKLGYENLKFLCMDISLFEPEEKVDAVVSLHACDIATDYVLAFAIKHNVKLIFSTPCCHHEMMHQISSPSLSFITDYPMFKQKLCDAATDALRTLLLKAYGYSADAVELIDPEETPKNIMIRARKVHSGEVSEKALTEYRAACALLGVKPYLAGLLGITL